VVETWTAAASAGVGVGVGAGVTVVVPVLLDSVLDVVDTGCEAGAVVWDADELVVCEAVDEA
jgi:hypothetical protein